MVFKKKEKTLFVKNKVGRIVEVGEDRARYMVIHDLATLVDAPVKEKK